MIQQENLAANFCGLLSIHGYKDPAIEWRILGQEQDGSLLASWSTYKDDRNDLKSNIGLYNPKEKTFQILHKFQTRENIIQASVNATRTLLLFVLKEVKDGLPCCYKAFLIEIKDTDDCEPVLIMERETKQIMTQFQWRKLATFYKSNQDKFLIMIHEECIYLYTATLKINKSVVPDDDLLSSSRINLSDCSR